MITVSVKDWIKALRSGKYKQAKGKLRRANSYCCLGVLCNLYDSNAWRPYPNEEVFTGDTHYWKDVFQINALPNSIKEKLAEELNMNITRVDHLQDSLISKNDHGDSFSNIADFLERTLKRSKPS